MDGVCVCVKNNKIKSNNSLKIKNISLTCNGINYRDEKSLKVRRRKWVDVVFVVVVKRINEIRSMNEWMNELSTLFWCGLFIIQIV